MYFIIFCLFLLPFVFICAGEDSTARHASRIQHQREAAMEWTNKSILSDEDYTVYDAVIESGFNLCADYDKFAEISELKADCGVQKKGKKKVLALGNRLKTTGRERG